MERYDRESEVMQKAASAAGEIQLRHCQGVLDIDIKEDASPVTQVDRLCEQAIRQAIMERFPSDGFLGEESGSEKGTSGRKWIVDPLDGTRPFIHGVPTYSVLIALEDGDELVAGCMHFPALRQTFRAQKGRGAFLNDTALSVSQTAGLPKVFGSGFGFIQKAGAPEANALLKLMGEWDYAYGFMDAYTYGAIAAGGVDVCVNLLDKPWDCAAAACIVQEAGGRYSDLQGRKTIYSGACILSNGFVHDAVLEYFSFNTK